MRLFELWDFSHPGAGNFPETTSPRLFPLGALILLCHCSLALSAICCCKPILFARCTSALKANLSGKADSAVLWKIKRIWWGRRESKLVCHSHSWFGSVFITISPENWNEIQKKNLEGGEKTGYFIDFKICRLWLLVKMTAPLVDGVQVQSLLMHYK